MKLVFIDLEFTGEHAYTTPVSFGLVTLDDQELYITLNDYSEDQVTDWLRNNVLNKIDANKSLTKKEAYIKISSFLKNYSKGEKIHCVSAGKGQDMTLLEQLYHEGFPNLKYFHALHCLPDYLNHSEHFDLHTIFYLAGIKEPYIREDYANLEIKNEKHNALYDAKIVKECFLKLMRTSKLKGLLKF